MFSDADIISVYTRAQAIEDGELVDVSTTAVEAGFRVPVALTRAAWADCVAWTEVDEARKCACQDEAGRLWDVLWMARQAAGRARGSDPVSYELWRVPREGRGVRARRTTLVLHIGPGDDAEPVMTIMVPGED